MPTFTYSAVDAKGQHQSGMVEASNANEASAQIKQLGFYPTSVVETARGAVPTQAGIPGMPQAAKKKGFFAPTKVKSKVLMVFTRQLATLIGAGLPLLRSLRTLLKQEKNPVLKEAMVSLSDSVESGSTFSESLAQHPRIFTKLYVSMVKAGELGGVLEVVLTRLAEFQEKSQRIRGRVISAMVYPIVVLCIAIAILCFLMLFIVPKFEAIFQDMLQGKPLPFLTQWVINFSRFIQYLFWPPSRDESALPIPYLPILIGLLWGCFTFFRRTEGGTVALDKLKLKLPLFGDLLIKTAIARFTRTLGTLVSSGVPILPALNITKETSGNVVVSGSIAKVHDSVKEGESMVTPLEASGLFPPMVISMIQVGEETGQLPEMLTKVADVYEEEVDVTVAGLTSLLEPIMIVILAVIVGVIVIALFWPLVEVIKGLSNNAF